MGKSTQRNLRRWKITKPENEMIVKENKKGGSKSQEKLDRKKERH